MMSAARIRWTRSMKKLARTALTTSLLAGGTGALMAQDPVYIPESYPPVEYGHVDPVMTAPVSPLETPMMMAPVDTAGRYFMLRHFAGDGVANEESFTTVGVFQPLTNRDSYFQGDSLWFTEGRFIVQNDGRVGGNLGLGYRRWDNVYDRLWGFNFWQDLDGTHEEFFYQTGFGFESLGEYVDFRANGYVPIGNIDKDYGYTATLPTARFAGQNIYFDRDRLVETAMMGVDTELGVAIPGRIARQHDIRTYAGWYHFDSHNGPEIDGVSARIEGNLRPDIIAQLSVTDDQVFNTNVIFGLTWVFSGRDGGSREPMNVRERIGQPVQRNHNVVVTKHRVWDGVRATDPTTGLPIVVVHAASSSASTGDGSFENPFSDISLAGNVNNSAPGDIVFAHAGSVFDGQQIGLQANQRLLGEGLDHMVDTAEFGTILMPRATSATAAPVIQNTPLGQASVSLASGTEVAGISVLNGLGPAILADGVGGNVSIHDNTVNGSLRGIEIRNSTGTFDIESTPISNTTGEGILLADNTSGTFNFNGVTSVASPQGVGISISGGAANVTFEEVQITNRGTTAIGIGGTTGGTITFAQSISNQPLTLQNPLGVLDETIGIANSASTIVFPDVVIDDSTRAAVGLPSVVFGSSTGALSFGDLDITNNNGGGLYAINIATLNVAGGTINTMNGEAAYINGATDIDTVFNSLSATGTNGVLVVNSGGRFLVTGDGSTPGSGGVLNTTGTGVRLNVAENVHLNFMNIVSQTTGITSLNTNDLSVNESMFTSNTDGWVAINVQNSTDGNTGTPVVLTNNTIVGGGQNQTGILVVNDQSPQGALRIDNHSISIPGVNGVGIDIRALDMTVPSGPGDIVVLSLDDNVVNAPTPFQSTETQATIFGQILVNGNLVP